MSEISREQIITWLKEWKAKAIFVENFPHLDKNFNAVVAPLIYFKPRVFGKSSRKSYIKRLGLKTKEDCEKLNKELS
jgi:N-dimethylarginine dimethylaminohydrolase